MPKGSTYRIHPPEFRAEAVRPVREGGRTPRQLAADPGCPGDSIRHWPERADPDAGRRRDGLTSEEREKLRRPRAGVPVLRLERGRLKRAAAFFAQDSDPTR